MKKILFLISLMIVMNNAYSVAQSRKDITKDWYKSHPGVLPHWQTEQEIKMGLQDYIRDFDETDPPENGARTIAEFEPMEAVMVRYPFGIPMKLIKQLSSHTKVITIVANNSEKNYVKNKYMNNNVNMDNCEYLVTKTDSYWTRDYTAWYIATNDEVAALNFPYNRPRPNDNNAPIAISQYLNMDLYGMGVVQTGGNFMADGMGAAAQSHIVYTESNSELHISEEEVDKRMHNYMGIDVSDPDMYHVVHDPNGEYINHVDCWGKYLAVDKIVIRKVSQSNPQYNEIEEVAEYFKNATTPYGNKYQVYRLYSSNDEPYTNSLILNNYVYVPMKGTSNDANAIAVYKEAMPGYTIVGVQEDPYHPWMGTDALHCRTHEVADRKMLYIGHKAIVLEQNANSPVTIKAEIVSYSKTDLIPDSLYVRYRSNGGQYKKVMLTSSDNRNFTAQIPGMPNETKIDYYIHASDSYGKNENNPYIGVHDPHSFTFTGSGGFADIDVALDSVIASVKEGDITEKQVIIKNNGNIDLSFSLSVENQSSANWLSLDPQSGSINPGQQKEITFKYDASEVAAGYYVAKVKVNSNDNDESELEIPVGFEVIPSSGINDNLISKVDLFQNYPNPFNPETEISFNITKNGNVSLKVYNTKGQIVGILAHNMNLSAGIHTFRFDGSALNSGIYYYRLEAEGKSISRKMILIK